MNPDAYLLPLCIGLTLVGLVATVITWRASRRRGKVVQMFGLALVPVGLYLSGLLKLVWNFVAGIVAWAAGVIFSPQVWAGLGFIGLAVVLWVIGGIFAARAAGKPLKAKKPKDSVSAGPGTAVAPSGTLPGKGVGRTQAGTQAAAGPAAGDTEMDEIEALLRKRGIE